MARQALKRKTYDSDHIEVFSQPIHVHNPDYIHTPPGEKIILKGVTTNNLKGIDIDLPKNQIITVTGVSGSGKSSFAFDTLYKEGQFRYIESLSSYLRQFFNLGAKPEIEYSSGLSPAVAIEQNKRVGNVRSSVGTLTEIDDYLRLLYAKVGDAYCYSCGEPIRAQSVEGIMKQIYDQHRDEKIYILQEIGNYDSLKEFQKFIKRNRTRMDRSEGYTRYLTLLEDESIVEYFYLESPAIPDKFFPIKVYGIFDRITVSDENHDRMREDIVKLLNEGTKFGIYQTLEGADVDDGASMKLGKDVYDSSQTISRYTDKIFCPHCNITYPEFTTQHFSPNRIEGACPTCHGIGETLDVDLTAVIDTASPYMEAIIPWKDSSLGQQILAKLAQKYGINDKSRWSDLPEYFIQVVIDGDGEQLRISQGGKYMTITYRGLNDILTSQYNKGVLGVDFQNMFNLKPCEACHGDRLRPESLNVFLELTSSSTVIVPSVGDKLGNEAIQLGNGITIELATPEDAQELEAARKQARIETYTKKGQVSKKSIEEKFEEKIDANIQKIKDIIAGGKDICLVKDQGKIVGFNYSVWEDKGRLSLGGVYLLKGYQGKGIGRKLMDLSLQGYENQDIYLHVVDYNTNAIKFYQHYNFKVVEGETETYTFASGESMTEICMVRKWNPNGHTKSHGDSLHFSDVPTPSTVIASDSAAIQKTINYSTRSVEDFTKPEYLLQTVTWKDLGLAEFDASKPVRPFRTKGVIVDENGNIIVMKPQKYEHNGFAYYELPGGGLDDGEQVVEGLKREILEETGYQVDQIQWLGYAQVHYNSTQSYASLGFVAHTKGKAKKIKLTKSEKDKGYEPVILPLDQLINNIQTYIDHVDTTLEQPHLATYLHNTTHLTFLKKAKEILNTNGRTELASLQAPHPSPLPTATLGEGARYNLAQLQKLPIRDLVQFLETYKETTTKPIQLIDRILGPLLERSQTIQNLGLAYINLARSMDTLSGGEIQRLRLAKQLGNKLTGIMYVLDEPTIGLDDDEIQRVITAIRSLKDMGNTIVVVEHNEEFIQASDWVVEIGPGAGDFGGELVFSGPYPDFVKTDTLTAQYVTGRKEVKIKFDHLPSPYRLNITGAHEHNLKHIDAAVRLGSFTIITGPSGAGKTTLMYHTLYKFLEDRVKYVQGYIRLAMMQKGIAWKDILTSTAIRKEEYAEMEEKAMDKFMEEIKVTDITGYDTVSNVIYVDQSSIGKTPRSCPATFIGVFDNIRKMFAGTQDAKILGFTDSYFSFNSDKGCCPECDGYGIKKVELQFLPDTYVPCTLCKGKRYKSEILTVRRHGKTINEILEMYVHEAHDFFSEIGFIEEELKIMVDIGLGYIKLGQAAHTLSGGESQRLKLVKHLLKQYKGHSIYFLDEPTVGLHPEDIQKLLYVLKHFLDRGDTILMIEHDKSLLQFADDVIRLKDGAVVKSGK